jgi:hypothetical protein
VATALTGAAHSIAPGLEKATDLGPFGERGRLEAGTLLSLHRGGSANESWAGGWVELDLRLRPTPSWGGE